MALLNDAQRAVLAQIETATATVAAEVQKINNLLREVNRRDNDTTGMNPGSETGAELIARARTAYTARRAALVAAVNALPVL